MPSSYRFGRFPTATYHEKQGTVPRPRDVSRFANIPNAYSGNTFFAKKRTLGEDFRMSHVLPFIASLAPMPSSKAVSLDVFTLTSSEWQEQCQVRWAQRIVYAMVCRLSLLVEMFSVNHYLVELFSDIARCVAHERTTFCFKNTVDLSLPIVLHVSQCVRVFGDGWMGRGKLYVCMLALCVCVGHCAVDWRALPNVWSSSSSRDFQWYSYTWNICFCIRSLVCSPYPVEHFPLLIGLGRA